MTCKRPLHRACFLASIMTLALALPGSARAQTDSAPDSASAPSTASTGTVRGTVEDKDTGQPLVGATVIVVGTEYAAFTEADGSYAIPDLPPGEYRVQFEAPGGDSSIAVVQVIAGQDTALDATLDADEFSGETIVVTGTRSPEKVFDSPITIEVVSAKDLEQGGNVNFMQALGEAKGVDFANAGLGDQRISARGFNTQFNSRMIAMIDGRLAQLPGNGLPQNNLMPTTNLDIKAMEVVVGPASALYGANAHSGVVNVLTKSPWDQSGAALAIRGGTSSLFDGAARLAGTFNDRLGWKINAQYLRAEDFKPAPDTHCYSPGELCEADLIHDYNIQSLRTDGSLYYKFDDWFAKASAGFSENDGFALTNNGRNHIRGWQVQYQALQLSGQDIYFQFTRTTTDAGKSYQLSALDAAAEAMIADDPSLPREQLPDLLDETREAIKFVDASQMLDAEAQYRKTFAQVKGTLGLQWRLYKPSSEGTYLDDADTEIQVAELGGYVQLDRSFLDQKLRLVGAARLDHHLIYGNQFSPKLSAVYAVAPDHKVRASYNRAFKSPTILENYLLLSGFLLGNRTGFIIRDQAGDQIRTIDPLVPEEVDAIEIGYKGVIGRSVFIDAVFHNSWYENFIGPLTRQTDPADPDNPTFAFYPDGTPVAAGTPVEGTLFTYTNFGSAQVRGIDVGASIYPMDGITLRTSASWISLSSGEDEAPAFNTPEFKLKASITVEDLGFENYFARLSARYQTEYDFASGFWVGTVPAGFFADTTLGYEFPGYGVSLSLHMQNILGNEDVEILGAPVSKRLIFLQLGYTYDGLNL